jgi:hypothetical protein
MGNELRKPRIVEVASQIRSFDVAVPETRHYDNCRDQQESEEMVARVPYGGGYERVGRPSRRNAIKVSGSGRNGLQVRALGQFRSLGRNGSSFLARNKHITASKRERTKFRAIVETIAEIPEAQPLHMVARRWCQSAVLPGPPDLTVAKFLGRRWIFAVRRIT